MPPHGYATRSSTKPTEPPIQLLSPTPESDTEPKVTKVLCPAKGVAIRYGKRAERALLPRLVPYDHEGGEEEVTFMLKMGDRSEIVKLQRQLMRVGLNKTGVPPGSEAPEELDEIVVACGEDDEDNDEGNGDDLEGEIVEDKGNELQGKNDQGDNDNDEDHDKDDWREDVDEDNHGYLQDDVGQDNDHEMQELAARDKDDEAQAGVEPEMRMAEVEKAPPVVKAPAAKVPVPVTPPAKDFEFPTVLSPPSAPLRTPVAHPHNLRSRPPMPDFKQSHAKKSSPFIPPQPSPAPPFLERRPRPRSPPPPVIEQPVVKRPTLRPRPLPVDRSAPRLQSLSKKAHSAESPPPPVEEPASSLSTSPDRQCRPSRSGRSSRLSRPLPPPVPLFNKPVRGPSRSSYQPDLLPDLPPARAVRTVAPPTRPAPPPPPQVSTGTTAPTSSSSLPSFDEITGKEHGDTPETYYLPFPGDEERMRIYLLRRAENIKKANREGRPSWRN